MSYGHAHDVHARLTRLDMERQLVADQKAQIAQLRTALAKALSERKREGS